MIAKVLGGVETFDGKVVVAKAPGMKYTHYAPKCGAVVAEDAQAAAREYERREGRGERCVIVARESDLVGLDGMRTLSLGVTDEEVCRHDLGAKGVCGSVMNRVNKSAGGNVVRRKT